MLMAIINPIASCKTNVLLPFSRLSITVLKLISYAIYHAFMEYNYWKIGHVEADHYRDHKRV